MERIWRNRYPPGVPFEVDVDAYGSITDLFDRSVAKFNVQTAFVHMDTSISYSDLKRLSDDFSVYLRLVAKLPPSARVALMAMVMQKMRIGADKYAIEREKPIYSYWGRNHPSRMHQTSHASRRTDPNPYFLRTSSAVKRRRDCGLSSPMASPSE